MGCVCKLFVDDLAKEVKDLREKLVETYETIDLIDHAYMELLTKNEALRKG